MGAPAKNVFQVHGIDTKEKVVVRKQLRRCIAAAPSALDVPFADRAPACGAQTPVSRKIRLRPTKKVFAGKPLVRYFEGGALSVPPNNSESRDAACAAAARAAAAARFNCWRFRMVFRGWSSSPIIRRKPTRVWVARAVSASKN
jgi:hypothetical protein